MTPPLPPQPCALPHPHASIQARWSTVKPRQLHCLLAILASPSSSPISTTSCSQQQGPPHGRHTPPCSLNLPTPHTQHTQTASQLPPLPTLGCLRSCIHLVASPLPRPRPPLQHASLPVCLACPRPPLCLAPHHHLVPFKQIAILPGEQSPHLASQAQQGVNRPV